jgi:hypothetical protein
MALRKLFSQGMPEPPPQATSLRDTVAQTLSLPALMPIRLFWDNLRAMRPWWPLLLPLLAWIGWRAYQRERMLVGRRSDALLKD